MSSQVVGGELGRNPAPAEGETCADHRHGGVRTPECAQRVWQQARQAEAEEHQRDRQLLRAVRGAARRRRQARSDHAGHDGEHREVLLAAGVLAEHPLGQEQQDEQAGRERRLHHDQRGEQQRQ